MSSALLAVLLSLSARAQQPSTQVLDLNCVDALVAVGESRLAGVFSYVPDKDSSSAFAALLVHDPSVLKKFIAKDEKDLKDAQGVSGWDHAALETAIATFSSPLGRTLEKPSEKAMKRMIALSQAPSLTLEQVTARRKK